MIVSSESMRFQMPVNWGSHSEGGGGEEGEGRREGRRKEERD